MSSITVENGKVVLRVGAVGTGQSCCCSDGVNCCPVLFEAVETTGTVTYSTQLSPSFFIVCTGSLSFANTQVAVVASGTPRQYYIDVTNFYSTLSSPGFCLFFCGYVYRYGPLPLTGQCIRPDGTLIQYPDDITLTKNDFSLVTETCTAAETACGGTPFSYGSVPPENWFPSSISLSYNPLP